MTFKRDIQHQELRPFTVYSNDYPGLTVAYFTARSTLLPSAFASENA